MCGGAEVRGMGEFVKSRQVPNDVLKWSMPSVVSDNWDVIKVCSAVVVTAWAVTCIDLRSCADSVSKLIESTPTNSIARIASYTAGVVGAGGLALNLLSTPPQDERTIGIYVYR